MVEIKLFMFYQVLPGHYPLASFSKTFVEKTPHPFIVGKISLYTQLVSNARVRFWAGI